MLAPSRPFVTMLPTKLRSARKGSAGALADPQSRGHSGQRLLDIVQRTLAQRAQRRRLNRPANVVARLFSRL
jgi:hypothetical protein